MARIGRRALATGGIAVGLTGLLPRPSRAATTLRLAHASSQSSLIDQAVHRFADGLSQRTNGALVVQDFPNGQLGDEGPIAEGVGSGSIDIGLGGVIDAIDPRLNVLVLPFLFTDLANVHRVLDGPVGKQLLAMGQDRGYRMLGFLDSGFRDFANTRRPIESPKDMQGLKIRTPPVPIILDTIRLFGALPQAIPFGQVYTALQSHLVDGVEPELRDFYDEKWYEVTKYLTISNYIWGANFWYMNRDRYESLPAAQRQALDAAVADTVTWYRGQLDSVYAQVMKDLKTRGVQVNTVDQAPFRALVGPVYEKYSKVWGASLVDAVRKAAAAS